MISIAGADPGGSQDILSQLFQKLQEIEKILVERMKEVHPIYLPLFFLELADTVPNAFHLHVYLQWYFDKN